ncbi:hypothetical protein GCM10028798_08860 [Humibacter antri]
MNKRTVFTAATALVTVLAMCLGPTSAMAATRRPSATTAVKTVADVQNSVHFPGNDGKHHTVTYDSKSIKVDGQRLNVFSGEFHYWREPSTSDWRDIFQKMRAAGFNAVSLYFFWGLHSSQPGKFDFSGIKNIDLLLTMAQQEGLYVIARPGPYINAEISMGGLPAYLTDSGAGSLRSTDDPDVLKQEESWLNAFDQIAVKHQVTDGGGSIVLYQVENEMLSDGSAQAAYMKDLTTQVKNDGITVPLFTNDYALGGRFVPGKSGVAGNVGLDVYGHDNYPLGFNCGGARGQVSDTESQVRALDPNGPNFIPEGQGGAFTPWGASFNTDQCARFVDPDFTREYGVDNIANGVTAFNYYMEYGGTNWGWTGSPSSGFTSYDYGAAINENRQLTPKLATQKEIGYYQQALPQLADMIPQSAPTVTVTSGSGTVDAYQRISTENKGTTSVTGNGARTLDFRQADSNATGTVGFTVPLTLSAASTPAQQTYTTDDTDTKAITYKGSWTPASGQTWTTGDYKGTETFSDTAGDTASYTFNGTGIQWIAPQSTNHGYADVSIDGKVVATNVDTFNAQNASYQFIAYQTSDLAPGQHTITITVTGQKEAASQGTFVSIDAFNVLNTAAKYTSDDTDAAIGYSGSWTHDSGKSWTAADYQGTETYSDTTGDSASYTFTGTGIQWIAPESLNHGLADVYIDGTKVGTVDTFYAGNPPQAQQVVFQKTGLSNAQHTIKIVVTGQKDAASQGTFVSIDAFNVLTAGSGGANAVTFPRVPQQAGTSLMLHGRDAIMVTADDKFGDHQLYYTTSELAGVIPTAQGDLLTLDGYKGDPGETVLHFASQPTVTTLIGSGVQQTWDAAGDTLRLNYTHGDPTVVKISGGGASDLLVNITNREAMADTWQVEGTDGATSNATVLAAGVELLRTVAIDGSTAELTGDTTGASTLTVYVPKGVTALTWNGQSVDTTTNAAGALVAGIGGPAAAKIPALTNWKVATDGPEEAAGYDDSGWTIADATTAANTRQGPGPKQGVVLDTDFYGFDEGATWYRAHFTPSSVPTSISLTGQGGSAANMLVWINGQYAGASAADGSAHSFAVPAGSLTAGTAAVVSVLVNNSGQNLDWSDNGLSRQNRGLYDADLGATTGAVTWRIQGAQGKENPADTARTMYNVGGLYGERAGWYLPGYPDSAWADATSFKPAQPGVTWYRTSFDLNVPNGTDTAFALKINDAAFDNGRQDYARAVIYINGWNTGYFVGNVGPQSQFTIPRGFLNMTGSNDIAIALTTEKSGQGPDSIQLVDAGTVLGGLPSTQNEAPGTPAVSVGASLSGTTVKPDASVELTPTVAVPALIGGAATTTSVDWGDGSKQNASAHSLAAFGTADAVPLSHQYRQAGDYTPTVTVRDAVSGSVLGVKKLAITVSDDATGGGSGGGSTAPGGTAPGGAAADGDGTGSNGGAAASDGGLASTGSDLTAGILAGLLLAVLGAGLVIVRKRRRMNG